MKSPDWIPSIWPIHLTESQMQSFAFRLSAVCALFGFCFRFCFPWPNSLFFLCSVSILISFFFWTFLNYYISKVFCHSPSWPACSFSILWYFFFRFCFCSFGISCAEFACGMNVTGFELRKVCHFFCGSINYVEFREAMWLMATILNAHTAHNDDRDNVDWERKKSWNAITIIEKAAHFIIFRHVWPCTQDSLAAS